jgi:hypothetical protein
MSGGAHIHRSFHTWAWVGFFQAEDRSIIKELEGREDFTDTCMMPWHVQRSIFTRVVRKYTGLSRSSVESLL